MNVAIAGAGVIGSAIAYYLSLRGVAATVIERHRGAGAASGKSGGFLARDWCTGQSQDGLARLSFDLHTDLSAALGTEYGYRRVDTYAVAVSERRSLKGYGEGLASDWISNECAVHQQLGDQSSTAQLIPDLFTHALLDQALVNGALLIQGEVTGVLCDAGAGRLSAVEVNGARIDADALVIAMGPWSVLAAQWMSLPAVYGLKSPSITLATGTTTASEVLFLDYEDEHGKRHDPELVPRVDGEYYICGFSDDEPLPVAPEHVSADEAQCDRLQAVAAHVAAELGEATVSHRQACYRPICEDAMPVMGAVAGLEGAYVATAHNCWGMLNAPATGFVMAELIADGVSSELDLSVFAPARLPAFSF